MAGKGSTKLRFLNKVVEFKQAKYFERFESENVNLMLKIRLNMVNIHANFKGEAIVCALQYIKGYNRRFN